MLATHGTTSASGAQARNSRSTKNRPFSEWSSRISFLGPNARTWRQISEPILPAAPVTRTTRSRRNRPIDSPSRWTGSRQSRSWISTSLGRTSTAPLNNVASGGMTLTFTPSASQVEASAQVLSGNGRCGDQDRPDPQAAGVLPDRLRRSEDLDTPQRPAVGGLIRVKEAYDLHAQLRLAPDGVCDRLARRASPDDQNVLLRLRHQHRVKILAEQPEGSP